MLPVYLHKAATLGWFKDVKALFETGKTDINAKSKRGNTALMLAAESGHIKIVEYLVGKGADIHIRNRYGWTAVMCALSNAHMEITDFLLSRGAVLSPQDSLNVLFLENAEQGRLEHVKELLRRGAHIQARARNGNFALHLAAGNGHLPLVRYFLETGELTVHAKGHDNITALILSAEKGHIETVSFLLQNGADVQAKNSTGMTALQKAARGGHTDILKLLLSHGAKLSGGDHFIKTPLMEAAHGGHLETVKFLLESGEINVNKKDRVGTTALMLAAYHAHHEVLTYLLNQGAEVNTQNKKGKTALVAAVSGRAKHCSCHKEAVRLLLSFGADAKLPDGKGRTAVELAKERGYGDLVQMMSGRVETMPRVLSAV